MPFFTGCFLFFYFFTSLIVVYAGGKTVVLADFESGIPCSDEGDIIGFRQMDKIRGITVESGTEGTNKSALFRFIPDKNSSTVTKDLFFQGNVRRMYLATKSNQYNKDGPNALSFWLKVNHNSTLISKNGRNTFGVWTYHWVPGDFGVGGKTGNELATDSMMHGYSNFSFNENPADKWVNVILTPSAFQQSRYYYHFYAARAITDDLKFYPSLRQWQLHFEPDIENTEGVLIDQIKLIYIPPTAIFENDFYTIKISNKTGDLTVPVTIKNPTDKDRRYRVFISSFLGVRRDILYQAHILTDSFVPPRLMQAAVNGDGGIGVVELIDNQADSVIGTKKEVFIPAGGIWEGKLVHHIKPEMLGEIKIVKFKDSEFYARRATLTTSVIVWDPYDETVGTMDYIKVYPSNADDGTHKPPPGFPRRERLPNGWRSEDIPFNQVGGYFVSVIHLVD